MPLLQSLILHKENFEEAEHFFNKPVRKAGTCSLFSVDKARKNPTHKTSVLAGIARIDVCEGNTRSKIVRHKKN